VTHGDEPTVHPLMDRADRLQHPWTPPSVVDGAPLRTNGEPEGLAEDAQWGLMLVRLATERTRRLLADAIGTLEQLVPAPDAPIDAALQDLRSALQRLGTS
jgi:hypothetical protein